MIKRFIVNIFSAPRINISLALALLMVLGGGVNALASDLDFSAAYAARFSDNIVLVPTNEQDEFINSLSLGLGYNKESNDGGIHLTAKADRVDYLNNIFDDENLFSLSSKGYLRVRSNFLVLRGAGFFFQGIIDPFSPQTPENRQDIGVLWAGPDLNFHLGPSDTLGIEARLGAFLFENSPIDNTREHIAARLLHDYALRTKGSLNVEFEEVHYSDGGLNLNFNRGDVFVRLDRTSTPLWRNTLDLGVTRIKQESFKSSTKPLARLSSTLRASRGQNITLLASVEFTDSGRELRNTASIKTGLNLTEESTSSDVFYTKTAGLLYNFKSTLLNGTVRMRLVNQDFQRVQLKNKRAMEEDIALSHDLFPTTRLAVFASFNKTNWGGVNRIDRERTVGTRLIYLIRKNFWVNAELKQMNRNSTDSINNYTANIVSIGLSYSRKAFVDNSLYF